jgi:hypothetical protein
MLGARYGFNPLCSTLGNLQPSWGSLENASLGDLVVADFQAQADHLGPRLRDAPKKATWCLDAGIEQPVGPLAVIVLQSPSPSPGAGRSR